SLGFANSSPPLFLLLSFATMGLLSFGVIGRRLPVESSVMPKLCEPAAAPLGASPNGGGLGLGGRLVGIVERDRHRAPALRVAEVLHVKRDLRHAH
ncbi:hypothetical protein, partial [Enterococcus faecium]|uniref:hypothetical protein n=1 Tax=Enterococcus faecium TaxID=1352 RepID=UPI0034E9472B